MEKIYEDEIQVRHVNLYGETTTSLKVCPHGNNVWDGGWNLDLCDECGGKKRIPKNGVM